MFDIKKEHCMSTEQQLLYNIMCLLQPKEEVKKEVEKPPVKKTKKKKG